MNKNMQKLKQNLIPALCILLSVTISYWSVNIGIERSLAGKEALVWLHVLLFLVAVGLVLAAILFRARGRR